MQISPISCYPLDFSRDHYCMAIVLRVPLTCQFEGMITLRSMTGHESSQYFGKIRPFGVLVEMCEFYINRLCFSVGFLKILKACVIAIMAPVSIFELMGDEYLDATPECHELVVRVGWLGFLQKFFGFNLAISRAFVASFDGIKA